MYSGLLSSCLQALRLFVDMRRAQDKCVPVETEAYTIPGDDSKD